MKQIMEVLVCLVLTQHTDVSHFRAVKMTFSSAKPQDAKLEVNSKN